MKYIFIMRHGPTKHDIIQVDKFKEIIDKIRLRLQNYEPIDKVITSPITRCVKTSQILKEAGIFNVEPEITNKLKRISSNNFNKNDKKKKAVQFGKSIIEKYNSVNNLLIITHSSVIKSLIEGITDKKISDEYYHEASLTIFNCETKRIEFNNINWT